MTKNERKMLLEMAKGVSRLSKIAEILAATNDNEETKKRIEELVKENEASLAEFIKLASKEWMSNE